MNFRLGIQTCKENLIVFSSGNFLTILHHVWQLAGYGRSNISNMNKFQHSTTIEFPLHLHRLNKNEPYLFESLQRVLSLSYNLLLLLLFCTLHKIKWDFGNFGRFIQLFVEKMWSRIDNSILIRLFRQLCTYFSSNVRIEYQTLNWLYTLLALLQNIGNWNSI